MADHFGEHITIDGYGADKSLLNNKVFILGFLKDITIALGMKILKGPEIVWTSGNDKKDPGGWSGFVVIEESHISIHTFPEKRFLSADVYTCKNDMDVKEVEAIFRQKFGIEEVEVNFIKRGLKYSHYGN